ncbi:MAG: hypothetical protein U1F67_15370 [Rubrivivax sp.]
MIPVIVIDALEHAVPLARALVAGGVKVLEVIAVHAGGAGGDERWRALLPGDEAIVGAGTLRSAV